jgi:ribosomal protein S18 acetylase RimI-like enzyme
LNRTGSRFPSGANRLGIPSLAVEPEVRRRGIGTALMRPVERALAGRGCPKVNLQVLASNAATVAFYEKLGYSVEERVSMGKLLGSASIE